MILYKWQTKMGELVEIYEEIGDHTRANTFSEAVQQIVNHAEQFDITVKNTKDVDKFKGLEGVGRSTLELFKEFVTTGEMKRLKALSQTRHRPYR
jgi:DNA polymerase/3'-5' exonuclease PolX